MPIYEYACRDCGHEFETLVRSDTVPHCPSCHSSQLEKQLSVFATTAASMNSDLPGPCGSCEHRGEPGPCGMH